jgi:3',5'-cyclic AMP phosphodiesterase CpdA
MTNPLHFAQISDIHISSDGDHDDLLSGQAAEFLTRIVTDLNQIRDLDFVLISGDLFDTASQAEFDQFRAAIAPLKSPTYIIPGNHDRRDPEIDQGLTRHQFAHHFNPQVAERPTDPEAQAGYWSVEINPQVQLIGLDSIVDGDWSGVVDAPQLAWLENQLVSHAQKFVILSVHHPLHKLAPVDDDPKFYKFVCDNGSEVLALLDQHPQVKLVLTGHHHQTKADRLGQRLHLAAPAVAIYPCAYRTLRLSQQADKPWTLTWQTHPVTNEATRAEARRRMALSWAEAGFAPDFVEMHIELALGTTADRQGSITFT